MKKLFYRLSSSRLFAKLFSIPMQARLDGRKGVMFPKSSVFAVVALAAFVSLGVLLFPPIAQAQCLWGEDGSCDLGSDPLNNSGSFSPGFSIVFCFDRPCVENLKDSQGNLIFTGDIPNALVSQTLTAQCPVPNINPPVTTTTTDITITGTVVAVLKQTQGNQSNILPQSAAEATFTLGVKGATWDCSSTSLNTLSRVVGVGELPALIFDASSSITIRKNPVVNSGNSSLTAKMWGGAGCETNSDGTLTTDFCAFPLGIVQLTANKLSTELPATGQPPTGFSLGEVYRGVGSLHFVAARACKGDAVSFSTPILPPGPVNPSTIACSAGTFTANAVRQLGGEWVSNFNPGSANSQFDIISPEFFTFIDPTSVEATLVDAGGIPITPVVTASRCFLRNSASALRCNFDAREFGLTQCPSPPSVPVVLRGPFFNGQSLVSGQKWKAEDIATCSSIKK
jgi:hypothetical protein